MPRRARPGRQLKTVGAPPRVEPDVDTPNEFAAAFFTAGYDYDDALTLADFWGSADPYEAKTKAGALLAAGDPLPAKAGVEPGR